MKRIGGIYNQICDINNLEIADIKARKGKKTKYNIISYDESKDLNILRLHDSLVNKTYETSIYKIFMINEGKLRKISSLPYYPDRIVHHAIMNKLEPIFVSVFTSNTYSCIKGRGIHEAEPVVEKPTLEDLGKQHGFNVTKTPPLFGQDENGVTYRC